jgi:hypothetical protein
MKVQAKDATIQQLIKHPNGKAFKDDGTAEWPDDQFTKRRIRDGDVTVFEEDPPPEGGAREGAQQKPASQHEEPSGEPQPHPGQQPE